MYWRLDKPPFNDPRVRQAVSMSLNRDNTISVLYGGRGGWNNFIPWALSEWWLDPQSADEGRGGQVLQVRPGGRQSSCSRRRATRTACRSTMLSTPGYGEVFVQSVELVQQDLKTAGIDATIKMQDYAQYIATTFAGKFDGTDTLVFGLETPFTEPHDYLFNMYHPKGTRNHAGINDDKLTAMIEQQQRTLDRRAAQAADLRHPALPGRADVLRAERDQLPVVRPTQPQMHDMFPRSRTTASARRSCRSCGSASRASTKARS